MSISRATHLSQEHLHLVCLMNVHVAVITGYLQDLSKEAKLKIEQNHPLKNLRFKINRTSSKFVQSLVILVSFNFLKINVLG